MIAIIAVLASLVTAAAMNALRRGRQTGVQLSMNQIAQSLESKKAEWGAYPPNVSHFPTGGSGVPIATVDVVSDFKRMFKKAFPRSQEPELLLDAIAGNLGNKNVPDQLPAGLMAVEALYFWLGGFSTDPQYPISGPGGPSFLVNADEVLESRNGGGIFDITLLQPRGTDGRFLEGDGTNGTGRYLIYERRVGNNTERRRINFWRYVPKGTKQPLVYFDASRHRPSLYFQPAGMSDGADVVYPLLRLRSGAAPNSTAEKDVVYAEKGKFQILHAGLDDAWGDTSSQNLRFPEGPFVGESADNLTNFTDGKLSEAAEQ